MRVLTVGDVCGAAGCAAVRRILPRLRREENIDLTVVNGENSAEGNGITPESAGLLFACGADVITGGNHTLRRRELHPMLDENPFLLRPQNLPANYGSGYCVVDLGRARAAILNLSGQVYLDALNAENPFSAADALLTRAKEDSASLIFLDFHAEATSEKRALGFYLDGRITALFGTHTHVQTADGQILPRGTGYITDLGMTGPDDSVLGVRKEIIIDRLKNNGRERFAQADGPSTLHGCIFDVDCRSGRTTAVTPIAVKEDPA